MTTTEQTQLVLAIDVGNSRLKLGLFEQPNQQPQALPKCLNRLAVPIGQPVPWQTVLEWTRGKKLTAAVAGANPQGVKQVVESWPSELTATPRVFADVTGFPIRLEVDEPARVGIDRVLNAVAANVLRRPGAVAIIVDSGTATTVDFVTEEGAFGGGAILPGLCLAAKALNQYTALLPLVDLSELSEQLPPAVGKNTTEAIRSGLYWGQLGAVRELVQRMWRQVQGHSKDRPLVLLTGGGGQVLSREMPEALLLPHLSLQGLTLVALNRSTTEPSARQSECEGNEP